MKRRYENNAILHSQVMLIVLAVSLWTTVLSGQGITRSAGLGLRGGFWKINNQTMGVKVGTSGNASSVNVEGVGASITFFSRLHQNWFIESSLGSVAKIHVTAVIPFIVGLRYDLLTSRVQSNIQPYICSGIGTYWQIDTAVRDQSMLDTQVATESDFNFGGYAGLGSNLTLASWFALNFDTRYHFVDFSPSNPNSGFEFSAGFCFMWGRQREIFKIQAVRVIVEDIYPAYYRFYNMYPLAMATIQNTAGFPIEVNLRSWIDTYTDGVRESGFIEIAKGESKDIPVYLLFGSELLQTENREPAVIDLEIEARAGITLRKSFSAQVVVHSRNAWNGDIDKLTVFVTPDDPSILQMSHSVIKQDTLPVHPDLTKFHQAQLLFKRLHQGGIRYQSDPNIPFDQDDRVQFAPMTLSLGFGDCDDLVVLYASLLESVGISTAFMDIQDPEAQRGHVYLIFNTELTPDKGMLITSNEKRTVVRESSSGVGTLWIPIETTLIQEGFETAWNTGAMQYLEEGILRQGLSEGWVKIIDVK
jgi:hypothetical protein